MDDTFDINTDDNLLIDALSKMSFNNSDILFNDVKYRVVEVLHSSTLIDSGEYLSATFVLHRSLGQ